MLYLRAQSILQLARGVYVFHMQSIYISRQGLHLVILLNDVVDRENGPDEAQCEEMIELEEWVRLKPTCDYSLESCDWWISLNSDLIDLFEAMTEWGAAPEEGISADYSSRRTKIKHHYAHLFKERFYFVCLMLLYPWFFVIKFSLARHPDPFGGFNLPEVLRVWWEDHSIQELAPQHWG
jgi:hypothetical protein